MPYHPIIIDPSRPHPRHPRRPRPTPGRRSPRPAGLPCHGPRPASCRDRRHPLVAILALAAAAMLAGHGRSLRSPSGPLTRLSRFGLRWAPTTTAPVASPSRPRPPSAGPWRAWTPVRWPLRSARGWPSGTGTVSDPQAAGGGGSPSTARPGAAPGRRTPSAARHSCWPAWTTPPAQCWPNSRSTTRPKRCLASPAAGPTGPRRGAAQGVGGVALGCSSTTCRAPLAGVGSSSRGCGCLSRSA